MMLLLLPAADALTDCSDACINARGCGTDEAGCMLHCEVTYDDSSDYYLVCVRECGEFAQRCLEQARRDCGCDSPAPASQGASTSRDGDTSTTITDSPPRPGSAGTTIRRRGAETGPYWGAWYFNGHRRRVWHRDQGIRIQQSDQQFRGTVAEEGTSFRYDDQSWELWVDFEEQNESNCCFGRLIGRWQLEWSNGTSWRRPLHGRWQRREMLPSLRLENLD